MSTAPATETKPATTESVARPRPHEQLPTISPPRLPYHPAIQERFGIDVSQWRALVEAIFPNATSTESVILALSYCRARRLDPFKRNVHIVPIWSKERRCYIDTIWPGIGELRTTAFRTGEYAGRGATVFGDDVKQKVGSLELTYPEWAQVSVFRIVKGQRVEFSGPRVYWIETYANIKRDDDTPNDMWATRPRGQLDKCAEAAALRSAFPEECGGDYIPEEVQHQKAAIDAQVRTPATKSLDDLTDRLSAKPNGVQGHVGPDTADETSHEPPPDDANQETPEPDSVDAILKQLAECREVRPVLAIYNAACGPDSTLTEEQRATVKAACDEREARIKATRGQRSGGELFDGGKPIEQQAGN